LLKFVSVLIKSN